MKANRKFINDEEAVSAVIGVILMVAITVAIAATVYVYVSGMLSPTPEAAPSIAWTVDRAANTVTITSGSVGDAYGSGDTANLIFRKGNVNYFAKSNMSVWKEETTSLLHKDIEAGDVLGFEDEGTYQVIWFPTDKLIGDITL